MDNRLSNYIEKYKMLNSDRLIYNHRAFHSGLMEVLALELNKHNIRLFNPANSKHKTYAENYLVPSKLEIHVPTVESAEDIDNLTIELRTLPFSLASGEAYTSEKRDVKLSDDVVGTIVELLSKKMEIHKYYEADPTAREFVEKTLNADRVENYKISDDAGRERHIVIINGTETYEVTLSTTILSVRKLKPGNNMKQTIESICTKQ